MASKPHQVVPGGTLPSRNSFSHTHFRGEEVAAFVSGQSVIISTPSHFLYRLDGFESPITAVKWCHPALCKLAVASGSQIFIYEVDSNKPSYAKQNGPEALGVFAEICWKRTHVIEQGFKDILAISWNFFGDALIAAGSECVMWQWKLQVNDEGNEIPNSHQWTKTWSTVNPTPVVHVAFSPDDRFFVTCGEFDRLAKIWYKSASDRYTFLYLPHPRSVVSVQWRAKPYASKRGIVPNVLLTVCRDGVGRLWTEVGQSECLQFHICASLTPNEDDDEVAAVQFLNKAEEISDLEFARMLKRRVASSSLLNAGHAFSVDELTSGTSESVTGESQTWVTVLQRSGTLSVRLVQGLADEPRQTPKVSTWMKIVKAFPALSRDPLRMVCFYHPSSAAILGQIQTNQIDSPTSSVTRFASMHNDVGRVSAFLHTCDGTLEAWEVNLEREALRWSSPARLLRTFTGHVLPVNGLHAHKCAPIVCAFDKSGVTLWHVEDSTFGAPEQAMTRLIHFPLRNPTVFSWIADELAFVVSSDNGTEIYEVLVNCPEDIASDLPLASQYPPIPSCYSIQKTRPALSALPSPTAADDGGLVAEVTAEELSLPKVRALATTNLFGSSMCVCLGGEGQEREISFWSVGKCSGFAEDFERRVRLLTTYSFPSTLGLPSAISLLPVTSPTATGDQVTAVTDDQRFTALLAISDESGGVKTVVVEVEKATTEDSPQETAPSEQQPQEETPAAPSSQNENDLKLTMFESQEWATELNGSLPFSLLAFDGHSRLCTGRVGSTVLKIWEPKSQAPNYCLEDTLSFPEPVSHIEWQDFGDNMPSLVVSTGSKIRLFTRITSPLSHHSPLTIGREVASERGVWVQVAQFDGVATQSSPIRALTLVPSSTSLVCSISNTLQLFTKWSPTQKDGAAAPRIKGSSGEAHVPLDSAVLELHKRMPDFHPQFLIDSLMGGKFHRVKKILLHLHETLKSTDHASPHVPSLPIADVLSTSEGPLASGGSSGVGAGSNLGLGGSSQSVSAVSHTASALFDDEDEAPRPMVGIEEDEHGEKQEEEDDTPEDPSAFTARKAQRLSESIMNVTLPGLTSQEQVQLLAVIDTFVQVQDKPGALDDSAVRFLLAHRIYTYMNKALPPAQRATRMKASDMAWALQSEAQDALLDMLLPADFDWPLLRSLGVVLWLKDNAKLKTLAEKLAKSQFLARKEILDCALLYLALKKKAALVGLCKLAKNQKLQDFYSHDFNEDKWKVASGKNAFALISRHQFQQAASFFLLSNGYSDAIEILQSEKNENDADLALFVARLFLGDAAEATTKVVEQTLLARAANSGDAWTASMCHWVLKNYQKAIAVLIETETSQTFDPSLLAYCKLLSSHVQLRKMDLMAGHTTAILLRTVQHHTANGSLYLALENVKDIPSDLPAEDSAPVVAKQPEPETQSAPSPPPPVVPAKKETADSFLDDDWDAPPKPTSSMFASPYGDMDEDFGFGAKRQDDFDDLDFGGGASSGASSLFARKPAMMMTIIDDEPEPEPEPAAPAAAQNVDANAVHPRRLERERAVLVRQIKRDIAFRIMAQDLADFCQLVCSHSTNTPASLETALGLTSSNFEHLCGMLSLDKQNLASDLFEFACSRDLLASAIVAASLSTESSSSTHRTIPSATLALCHKVTKLVLQCVDGSLSPSQCAHVEAFKKQLLFVHSAYSLKDGVDTMASVAPDLSLAVLISMFLHAWSQQDWPTIQSLLSAPIPPPLSPSHAAVLGAWSHPLFSTTSDPLSITRSHTLTQIANTGEGQPEQLASLSSSSTATSQQNLSVGGVTAGGGGSSARSVSDILNGPAIGFGASVGKATATKDLTTTSTASSADTPPVRDLADWAKAVNDVISRLKDESNKVESIKKADEEVKLSEAEAFWKSLKFDKSKSPSTTSPAATPAATAPLSTANSNGGGGLVADDQMSEVRSLQALRVLTVLRFTMIVHQFAKISHEVLTTKEASPAMRFSVPAQSALWSLSNWSQLLVRRLAFQPSFLNSNSTQIVKIQSTTSAADSASFISPSCSAVLYSIRTIGAAKAVGYYTPSNDKKPRPSAKRGLGASEAAGPLLNQSLTETENMFLVQMREHLAMANTCQYSPPSGNIFSTPALPPACMNYKIFGGDNTSTNFYAKVWSVLQNAHKLMSSSTVNAIGLGLGGSSAESGKRPASAGGNGSSPKGISPSTSINDMDQQCNFTPAIEVVKAKDIVRSFCVNKNNQSYVAYCTGKSIREVNVQHSVRYRKRSPSLLHVLDDELTTWDQCLARFDNNFAGDMIDPLSQGAQAPMPSLVNVSNQNFSRSASEPSDVPPMEVPPPTAPSHIPRSKSFGGVPRMDIDLASEVQPSQDLTVSSTVTATLPPFERRATMSQPTTPASSGAQIKRQKSLAGLSSAANAAATGGGASSTAGGTSSPATTSPTTTPKAPSVVDHEVPVRVLESHPFLPYYLSGGADGAVYLWQFGVPQSIKTYRGPGTDTITSIHYAKHGQRFGTTDAAGFLSIWKADASFESLKPIQILQVHGTRAADFCFLNAGSLFATIGHSTSSRTLAIWDILMPANGFCVGSYPLGDAEPVSLLHSPRNNMLFVGDKKGDISVFDLGQRKFVHTIHAHTNTVRTMCFDAAEELLFSGSTNGDIKVWQLSQQYAQLAIFEDCHPKQTFIGLEGSGAVSTYGVTRIDLAEPFFYSCGADGRVLRRTVFS